MDDSLEDLGEDFYDNDFHHDEEEQHYAGDVGDDHHDDYEHNFGGDVYDDHPENNPYEEEMYHPGTEEEHPQETYQSYEEQPNEEEHYAEEEHFENYEEEEQQNEENPYEEQIVEVAQATEEEQHCEGNTPTEMKNQEETQEDDSQFEDFDPYGSYESDTQAPQESNEETNPEMLQEPQATEQVCEQPQLNQENNQQTNVINTSSPPQELKSIVRERPKSASRPTTQNSEKTAEKKKPSSRPSSTEKKKPFTTVEEYIYKPYYENRQKFYDENEIREYMKEKRRKEKEKLRMRPPRNNNMRKKPYDEEKVKEFMKQKQVNDKKLAEQKKQEEIQKKIGKKDALKRLDEYIHELFTNPPPPPEDEKSKKKKPEMPQFLKEQLEGNENTDSRKRVKDFGKKVRSKLAVDHERKKKLKEAAQELARELRRRNLHKIKKDSPLNAFMDEESESTNSSVWSLWSAPAKPVENNKEYLKGKSEIRDFSFPIPKHVDCTYNDISSIEPRLTEADIERRKIIENALQLISSARKAKEEVPSKPIDTTYDTREPTESKPTISSSEKSISNRMLPQFPSKERKEKASPEKKEVLVEAPIPVNLEETSSSENIKTEAPTSPHQDTLSETIASSPSVVYSEYSIKSDRSSLHPFSSQLKRNDSESSSLDNSNLDPIVITLESKQRYFNPVEYETYHNSESNKVVINNSELSEGTNSESSIIVDSSSENSLDNIEDIHEHASFNPSTAIFSDELIKKDNAKEIELHFSKPKERNIQIDPNYNSFSIEMISSPSVTGSSEIEKISYFSKKHVREEEQTEIPEKRRANKRQKEKSKEVQTFIETIYIKESRSKSKITSNETSSVSSDISSASLLSIENDSETSVLLEEVRKKKEEIKKQVFLSLKNSKNDKLASSYKRNKSKIASSEVDPFNIISTIKAKSHSEIEKERRYKKEKIKEEIKQYKECKPQGLEIVSKLKSKQCSTSCQTQPLIFEECGKGRSIEVQTSTPVDIVYDSNDEILVDQEEDVEPRHSNIDMDAYMRQFQNPVFIEPEVDRLSPDELVERLLDSLQVYEKVFESDVRLTRLLASSGGSYK
ncbi:predicted protein [Naegleria gruberi]|uniref:Predicted protein n=1 Tax=Naegleria gruberi TaxID=5762 RepID=D2VL24_NAEGR|nr:uncharacterized protein NAEGRDRAFT_69636 [Naegleria gruberi]EFC42548.1 predicted protein [Naegleria gruberi]|eukprot:XP_002675292.1 predicted protein [Naegleria gruberi strain NEG-M]